jgi:3-oxoacyl-[acyl-carrier-protein] synthase-3
VSAPIQSRPGAKHARILGVGGYRPTRVVPNSEIVDRIDSSDEWIQTRSGIKTRHWASPEETVAEMSIAAAGKALAYAGVDAEQIGCVIVASVTHLKQTPAIATEIAYRLNAGGGRAAAFDVSAACAGFCYGVNLAGDMVKGGSAEYVLVIGVERLSDLTNPDDRGSAFIFGDGAGAVVVGPSEFAGIGPTVWGSDGSNADAITQDHSWETLRSENRRESLGGQEFPTLSMEGQKVFRWAVFEMAKVCKQALAAAGVEADQLDAFIPHQANMRITDAMIKTLKLPESVPVARDIETTGNTSAASIPLAMERMLESGEAQPGGTALIMGFGAGLVYAGQVITLP